MLRRQSNLDPFGRPMKHDLPDEMEVRDRIASDTPRNPRPTLKKAMYWGSAILAGITLSAGYQVVTKSPESVTPNPPACKEASDTDGIPEPAFFAVRSDHQLILIDPDSALAQVINEGIASAPKDIEMEPGDIIAGDVEIFTVDPENLGIERGTIEYCGQIATEGLGKTDQS